MRAPVRRGAIRYAALAAAMAILGCQGETAPRSPRPVAFSLAPRFQQITASFVPFDRVRITLSRGTDIALDTTITFPANVDSLALPLSVVISGATETLTLDLAMIDAAGDTVFRGGPVPVTVSVANGAPVPVPVTVRYTGVGANAKSVRIATKTASVFFRDSVTLTATALDSSGQPIPGTPIGWASLDSGIAKVPADTLGKVVAGLVRGVARIRAELPTGQADTAQVTVEPVPVALGIVSGNGQSGPVGAALAQQLDVRVKAADSLGVAGVVVNFTVASGGGSVSTTTDTTSSTGDATTTWTLGGVVGAQTVTATVAGAPTLTVTLGATAAVGAPKKLAFQVQPSNVSANVAMAPAVQVVAQDSFGNAVTTFSGNVTLAIGANPGSATLGGTLTAAAASGVASFGTLTLNLPGTGYTLVASSAGLTSATSGTFNVTGGVPTQLAFVQQPSNATSGASISPAVTVQILDANGILVPTATNAVTVAIGTNPGGGTLTGTKTVNAAAGVATFAGLSIDKAGAGYTLAATATGLSGATSGAFNITAGVATQLALTTQPSAAAQSGVAFAQQPVVQIQDASGNAVSQSGVVVTAAIATGAGTIGGALTATTNASGAATFTNLMITGAVGARTLTFTASGLTAATSGTVTLSAGAAAQLAIATQPSAAAQSGIAFAQQPVVQLQDAAGNAVSQSGVVVTAAIATGGGTLGGTLTATTSAGGAATFTNLAITGSAGARTLTFTASGLTAATSGTVTLSAGAAAQLAITTQPSAAAQSGVAFSPQPVIQVQDAAGNAVSQSGVVVTAAIATGGGTLGGTLTATTNAGGAATFTNLAITGTAGARTLSFSASGLTSATSGTVVVGAGAPAQLAITTQPSAAAQSGVAFAQQPVIQLQDASGNPVSQSGVVVTAAIATGGGTLGGTLTATTSAGGTATFTNLAITGTVGARTLTFSASGLTSATSGTVTVSAGAATQLAITTQPSAAAQSGAAFAQQPVVQLQDASGNPVSQSGVVVTAAIATGGGTLGGTLTATTNASGAATFTNLMITGTVGARTLSFSASGLTSATSGTITVSAGAATQLVITTQPSATAASGAAFAQQPVIQLQDASGNPVSQSGVVVTAAIATGGGTLGGTLTATTSAGGAATFTNLSIAGLVGARTLTFTAAGVTAATSGTVTITVGAASKLVFTTEPPASATAQAGFGFAVTAQDGGGNTVSTFTSPVTVAIATNPAAGTLSGTLTQNAVAGVATFSGISIDNIGTGYTLSASATGVTSATSSAINILAALNVNAWINSAGGNWSTAANWSKGAVPVATDTVQIKQSGTYTVTVDVAASFARIDVGAPTGTQTVSIAAPTLTAGNGAFAANTVLNLSGTGTITGAGTLTTAGAFNWTGGNLGGVSGAGGTLRVLSGGTLSLAPSATVLLQSYALELAGAGTWTGTQTIGASGGTGGVLRVLAGGTLDIQGDPTFGGGAIALDVEGTVNRTTSAGTATISAPFNDSGTVNIQSGTLRLTGSISSSGSSGAFSVAAGATLDFDSNHALGPTASVTGAGTVTFTSGSVISEGGYNVSGSTQVAGGVVDFNAATSQATSLNLSSGTLAGTGLLTVSGPMTWTGGALGGDINGFGGTTRVLSGGTLSIAPTANVTFQAYTLELAGTGTWTGTSQISTGSGAVLRIASGGSLDIQGYPMLSYTLGGAAPSVNVLGTLVRSTDPNDVLVGEALNDSGSVSIQTGTLTLLGGGASTGAFTLSSGANLSFGGGTHGLSAASSVSGAGTVYFSGGTTTVAGSYAVTSTQVAGGTANFNMSSGSTGSLTVSSGTLGGTGLLTVGGPMSWTGGNLSTGSGTTKVLAGGTLSLAPTAGIQLQAYTLELAGTGAWSTSQTLATGNGAVLRVDAGATLTISADPIINSSLGGAAPLLDNQGTITRNTSANAVTIGVPFNQVGTLNLQTGSVSVAGGGTMSGPTTLSSGTVLQFTAGATTLANGFRASGTTGITQIAGATMVGLAPTDTAYFSNLQLLSGTLNLSGGTIKDSLSAIWAGSAELVGGTLFNPVGGTLNLSFAGTATLVAATVLNAGSAAWTGAGTLNSGSGAVIRNLPGATFVFAGAGSYLYNQGGGASLFDNQGTLTSAVTPGSPGAAVISAQISNTGTLQVSVDTLRLSGGAGGTFPGALTVNTGATLEFGGSTFTLASPLSVGGNLLVSGGTLALNGKPSAVAQNFATSGSGVLQMTSAADSLGVGGNASFGGGSTAGMLTAGIIDLKGGFAQSGNVSSFAPSTAQRTRFDNGSGALQTISFASPTQSFFDSLIVDRAFSPGTVQLLTDAQVNRGMLIQNSSTFNGAGRLTIAGGTLQTVLSTTSPSVTPLVIEMSAAPLAGGSPALISPDTMVYDGAITTLPTGSGIVYKSVRINTTGALSAPSGNVTFNGDLIVSSGAYTTGSGIDSVGGFLRTEGTGALSMVSIVASPTVAVRDSAVFAGGPSTALTGGLLRLYGNFVERGTTGQFAPTGTRVSLQKTAAGAQTIQMADSVGSFFHDLVMNRASVDTIRLLSNVLVQDSAIVQGKTVLSSTTAEALMTPATGALRLTGTAAILRPNRVEFGTLQADSVANASAPFIIPDTAVFLNGGSITSSSPGYGWKSVRVAGGAVSSFGTIYNGNLIISGGSYGFCTSSDSVGGFFRTEGTGILALSCQEGEAIAVRDSAVFGGGDETGQLTGGIMRIGGDFVQRGLATSYTADPGHSTYLVGTSAAGQHITFASPGFAGASHFGYLQINNLAGPITLNSSIFTTNSLADSAIAGEQISGTPSTVVTVEGIYLNQFTFNGAPLVVLDTAVEVAFQMEQVKFSGYDPTVDEMTVEMAPSTVAATDGADFTTALTSGHYLNVQWVKGTGTAPTMTMNTATPAAQGGTSSVIAVTGPFGTPVIVWP